jgi:hypothetical protein
MENSFRMVTAWTNRMDSLFNDLQTTAWKPANRMVNVFVI